MRVGFKILTGAAVVALLGTSAEAAVHHLNLSGKVANFAAQPSGSHTYYFLLLNGLAAANEITVSQGDEINATVALDQAYTVPASGNFTDFIQDFGGLASSSGVELNGVFTLYDAGAPVAVLDYSSNGPQSYFESIRELDPPYNHAYTFDAFTNDFTVEKLGQPTTFIVSHFIYVLGAVPEPGTWTILLAGLFGMGAALRRRRPAFCV